MKKLFEFLLSVSMLLCLMACSVNRMDTDKPNNTLTKEIALDSELSTQNTEENAPSQAELETKETTEKITGEPKVTETKDNSKPQSETPTEAPPEIPKEPATPTWKEAYLTFLNTATVKDYHVSYALVYVDNDNIPELYLNGDCAATGDTVCTFINGSLVEQQLNRNNGGRYIERSGALYNCNGNMGYYTTHVYKLTAEGFSQTFYALMAEKSFEQWVNRDPMFSYEYFVENVPVSETEYNNATSTAFNYAQSKPLHENAVSYDQIVEQIKQHK